LRGTQFRIWATQVLREQLLLGFLLLLCHDEGLLVEPRGRSGGTLPTVAEARAAIAKRKIDLLERRDAAELFGLEREDGLAALLGNLEQTVFGAPAYPTLASRAAHVCRRSA
jgi:hypothetical protein